MPMNETVLNNELDTLTMDATGNNSTFIKENEELLDRYEGNPYGDEVAERSKVVATDVQDTVESDMTALTRVFLGPGDILKFKPNSIKEDDVKEAEDKTKYINWQIRDQPWSFSVLHGFIKNAEIHKLSVLKYFYQETIEVEEHKKTGISDEELAVFQTSLEGEDVKSVEIDREEKDGDEVTVVIKVEKERKGIELVDVKLENFRMTKNAESKETAALVGDVSVLTRGELMKKGFSRSLIASLPLHGVDVAENSRLPEIRDKQEGGPDDEHKAENWAGEEVEVEDLYPLIDYDEDGIAERRHIMRSGDVILINEVFNHVPYAMNTSILMPHKVIGKSRAEVAAPFARIKTAIARGVQDNIYAVNNPRIAVNDQVEMDDLLFIRPNGVIRNNTDTNPAQNMFPIEVPYIGDKALQVIQYWNQEKAQATGNLMSSQGLDADDLGRETATRFEGVKEIGEGKVELVARVMAETGFRQLYEGVAWLDSNFQNSEVEIAILGEELKVNPGDWKFKHHVVSKVGLGAGDEKHMLETMSGLWAIHQQLLSINSPMTDEVKRYNVLKNIVNASGIPEEGEFFNNPEQPEQLLQAQNEIMTRIIEQLQGQVQGLQNPLAEAETIKAQASLIKATGEQSLKVGQMQEDQRQFNAEMAQSQEQFNKELAAKLTELELKFQQQVPGALTE